MDTGGLSDGLLSYLWLSDTWGLGIAIIRLTILGVDSMIHSETIYHYVHRVKVSVSRAKLFWIYFFASSNACYIEGVAGRVRGPGGKPAATRLLRVGVVEATEGR